MEERRREGSRAAKGKRRRGSVISLGGEITGREMREQRKGDEKQSPISLLNR
jgi:hypothetical protein